MNKRLLIIVGIVAVAGMIFLVGRSSSFREPVYEGRTLSSWLDHHVASSSAVPPYNSPGWKKADGALRAIGSNAVPTLLTMIRAKDPPPIVLKAIQFAGRYLPIHYRYASRRQEEAEYAFKTLGTNGVSAVPELIGIYQENISPSSQRCAASALGSMGKAARPALPVLLRDFSHTNAEVRFNAVSAVMFIGGDPGMLVPPLTRALQDSSLNVRWNALVALEIFGSDARSAAPEILKLMNDTGMVGNSSITQQVQTTLWRVAPEKVGEPLVVEEATPIVAHGVTVEALKVMFGGKRETLIKQGTTVPAVAQYWNSDPRPQLSLFRGADKDPGTDTHLGDFEVLDLPASGELNVSTLCVIADGRIYLCARDNHRDVFLPIRRAPKGNGP